MVQIVLNRMLLGWSRTRPGEAMAETNQDGMACGRLAPAQFLAMT